MRNLSGARVARVLDGAGDRVREHAHDWPVLSIFTAGAYTNRNSRGEMSLSSPSVVLYGAGQPHENLVGEHGFEQLEIEFDPRWLGAPDCLDEPVRHWVGGRVGLASRALARRIAGGDLEDAEVARLLAQFLRAAGRQPVAAQPAWVGRVVRGLRANPAARTPDLARAQGLHPAWMSEAYRAAVGEGIRETARRFRVQTAAHLLRSSDAPAAQIAVAAGFCDQSHMTRGFRQVLGRTPGKVRAEWRALRPSAPLSTGV